MRIEFHLDAPVTQGLVAHAAHVLEAFLAVKGIARIEFVRQTGSDFRYAYEFTMVDGRKWAEMLTFSDPPTLNVLMSLSVTGTFFLDELSTFRAVRDACTALRVSSLVHSIVATAL